MSDPILYDSHMHTPLCKHARGQPEDYAAVAEKRGLKGIVFTCHNPIPDGYDAQARMDISEFDDYVNLIARAQEAWQDRIDIRLGLESDYYPGAEPWLEELHAKAEFHHILGSVHPQTTEYQNRYLTNGVKNFQRTYYAHLAIAAETGLFDTLSHPDVVKIVHATQWKPDDIMDNIRLSLDRIAKTEIAMELNTSGLLKIVREMNPGRKILIEMQERNIPVVVNSDAHDPHRVAADFETAFDLLLEVGYTETNYFLKRQRHSVDIQQAKASLKPLPK